MEDVNSTVQEISEENVENMEDSGNPAAGTSAEADADAEADEAEELEDDDDRQDFYGTLFSGIKAFYEREVFCDLRLYAQSSNVALKGRMEEAGRLAYVPCHALVLASVVPALKNLLKITEWDPKVEAYCIYLPDVEYVVIKKFVIVK